MSVKTRLPTDSDARKEIPLASGCLDYFPDALAAVAELSYVGNAKHNPGQPLHWSRGKSMDQADCLLRHFIERGAVDTDGIRHSVKVAWRALAMLQQELEEAYGLPVSRGSREEPSIDEPVPYRPTEATEEPDVWPGDEGMCTPSEASLRIENAKRELEEIQRSKAPAPMWIKSGAV